MSNTKEINEAAPPTMLAFSGTPLEIGQQIWMRMCCPAVAIASKTRPEEEIVHLYCGFLMACMGSMAADIGHQRAIEVAQLMADTFALADLQPPKGH